MSSKRERQLARERHERQQARRAAARARARRRQQVIAAAVAVLAVFGGVFALSRLGGDSSAAPLAAGTPSPDASADASAGASPGASATPDPNASSPGGPGAAGGACTYTPTPQEPAAKDVGLPAYDPKKAAKPYTATLATDRGDIAVQMLTREAPCTAASFRHLAEKKYFDSTKCHRLTTEGIFVLQCGDPAGTGSGGPGYGFGIENAPPDGKYPAGTVAMARTQDPNSNGSQFFLVYKDSTLPTEGGGYTVFGRVTKGLDVLTKVADAGSEPAGDGTPKQPVTIESVKVKDDKAAAS